MRAFSTLRVLGLIALLTIQACASSHGRNSDALVESSSGGASSEVARPGLAPIPGGYWMYSFGVSQKPEDLENIEVAQSYYGIWRDVRSWARITSGRRASATRGGLQAYYPLHVRWKLKDGREFIAEGIDVAAIMLKYFSARDLQLQWRREGRSARAVGDAEPLLAHEVKDDGVILKWVITINRTPVQHRLTSTGAATKWDTYDEEHFRHCNQGRSDKRNRFQKNVGVVSARAAQINEEGL